MLSGVCNGKVDRGIPTVSLILGLVLNSGFGAGLSVGVSSGSGAGASKGSSYVEVVLSVSELAHRRNGGSGGGFTKVS